MVKVCAKNLTSAVQACAEYKENAKNFSVESVIDNFLGVNIYFEDVNYEVITESAKYDEFQLLSNIGGTLGLFVGASVLSFVEIIQMLLEVVAYICKSRSKKNKVQELKVDEKA
ncbi:acid-sensing ion channel 1-like [Mizuhopecten yessoensis]|uniref:acid-sensing ion channel 1-like n=1 Tax=Mizuhopecten yessoensis TaxID=6573 RepID=UPI000B459747|nr:acid-sensing ion channel 1-like [Mizuhopecten yessoensis]